MNIQRKNNLQNLLQENGVGAFLLWRNAELVMTLGYQPLWGISFCLFPVAGTPILYIPVLETRDRLPKGTVVKTFPWGVMNCRNPWDLLYKMIEEDISNMGIAELPISFIRNIGQSAPAQTAGEGVPLPSDLQENLKSVSNGGYKDISAEFSRLYTIKNKVDIEHIAFCNKIAGIGIKAFYKNLIPGKSEVEVASAVEAVIQNSVDDVKIWYAKAWPYIQSGSNAAYGGRYNRSTGKKLKEGELVMIEMAVCVNGYWADITRTAAVGDINTKLQDVFNVVKEAQNRAVKAIEPGIEGSYVDKIARDYINKKGYGAYYTHALGHHVGFCYHDAGIRLAPTSKLILEEGMIVTVEPGIYGEALKGGCRIEDNVLVTPDGHKVLSEYSRELKWKEENI